MLTLFVLNIFVFSLLEELPENLSDTSQDLVRLSHLTAGYEELYKTGLLLPALKESGQEKKIALKFMHAVFKVIFIFILQVNFN